MIVRQVTVARASAQPGADVDPGNTFLLPSKVQAGSSPYERMRDQLVFRRFSPKQIAARLKVVHERLRLSHKTIYATIFAHRGGVSREGLMRNKPSAI